MALDSLGKLESFSEVFDLAIYRKHIFKYKCKQRILYNFDPFARDNIKLACKKGKYIPSLLLALIVCSPLIIRKIVKQIFKSL